jgi:hypothetical protein
MAMILQFADELVKEFERLNLKVVAHVEGVTLEVQSTLEQEIRKWQSDDAGIQKIKESIKQGEAQDFTEEEQETVWFKNRLCVPETGNLRETILREAHDSAYFIHSGSTNVTTRISANGNPTLCTSVIVPGRGYHVQSLSQVVQIHTTRE